MESGPRLSVLCFVPSQLSSCLEEVSLGPLCGTIPALVPLQLS